MGDAARLYDEIEHTSALAGFLAGAIMGCLAIAAAAFVLSGCGLLVGLVLGALLMPMMNKLAWGMAELGKSIGSMFTSPTGSLLTGSHNVFINGRKAIPVAMSIAGCACHPPVPLVAEGSGSVFINSQAAARVKDKLTCGSQIASGSGNVLIGGGTKRYLDVQEEVSQKWYDIVDKAFMVAEFVGGLAGAVKTGLRSGTRCALKFAGGFVVGEAIGRFVVAPAIGKTIDAIAGFVGNPVDVITGQKVLFGEEDIDFSLPGRIPLTLQRFYDSRQPLVGMFGRGWRCDWERFLQIGKTGITYYDAMGRAVPFPLLKTGEKIYNYEEQTFLTALPDGRFCINGDDELFWIFSAPDKQGKARFQRLESRQQQWVNCHYDAYGRLAGLEDSSHNQVIFHYYHENSPREADQKPPLTAREWRVISASSRSNGSDTVLVHYEYDQQNQLNRVSDSLDRTRRVFSYQQGYMVSQQRPDGLTVYYQWQQINGQFRVSETHDSAGGKQRYCYDFENGITEVQQLPTGLRLKTGPDTVLSRAVWQYDKQQRVTDYTDFDRRRYQMQYNEQGELTALILPGERTVSWVYDELGRVTSDTDPLGQTTHHDYLEQGFNVVRRTFSDGSYWKADYNKRGELITFTDPLGRTTHYDYNGMGDPVRQIDANQGVSELSWNDKGQLLSYLDCSNHLTSYRYTAQGLLSTITDSLGHSTHYHYDKGGLLSGIIRPDGTTESFSYNERCQLTGWRDGLGQSQSWQFNDNGLLTSMTDRQGRRQTYHYDRYGQLTKLENGNGGRYRFRYDAVGRQVVEQRPDNLTQHLHYDENGLLTVRTEHGSRDKNGHRPKRQQHYRYDAAGRLLEKGTESAATQYSYDSLSRLTEVTLNPTEWGQQQGVRGDILKLSYNAAGELIQESGAHGVVDYGYDALGNLTRLGLPDDNALHWLHYGAGHVQAIKFNQQLISEFERNGLYQETSRSQGQLTQLSDYDRMGRLTGRESRMEHEGKPESTRQAVLWRHYQYTGNGDVSQIDDSQRGISRWYYDFDGRLMYRQSHSAGLVLDERTYFDGADNRLETTIQPPYQDNRLTQLGDIRQCYDSWGNVTEKVSRQEQHSFSYDSENRLIAAQGRGVRGEYRASYHYDGLGRRIEKVVSYRNKPPQQTTFLWQGLRLLQERSGKRCRTYVYSPDEPYSPLAYIEQQGQASEPHYYHTELNGAPLEVTDEGGKIVWSGEYSDWGQVKRQNLTYLLATKTIGQALHQPLRYAGQYCDEETGLHYNTLRYYDPELARFTTQDPIGLEGGLNLYAYAPNPLMWIDPWGLSCQSKLAKQGEDLYVGTYSQVRGGNIKSGLNPTHTPHHAIQNAASPTTHGKGITINIRKDLHELTWTYKKPMVKGLSNREYLARDIVDLRKISSNAGYKRDVINRQLGELIKQNKELWKTLGQ